MNDRTVPVIEVDRLAKTFRDFWRRPTVRAVDGISFQVMPGQVVGLLGPNGSGKSTTIKLLLGLLHPTAGDARVLGCRAGETWVRRRIGYMPEDSYLHPFLTARETLAFYASLFDLPGPTRRRRIAELLEMTGLNDAADRAVGEYSKGMARRLGLAQALLNRPELLILDEPTAGLDPIACRQVKDLLRTLAARGTTLLLTSHLLADVESVCDRVLILYGGKVRASGTVATLLERRDETQFTVPALNAEQTRQVLALLRDNLGREPTVSHPTTDLETYFVDVIARAAGATAARARNVAPFLIEDGAAP